MPALVLLVHDVDDVVRVVDPETEHGIKARAGNEASRIFVVSQCTVEQRLYYEGSVGKILFVKKYLITSLVSSYRNSSCIKMG